MKKNKDGSYSMYSTLDIVKIFGRMPLGLVSGALAGYYIGATDDFWRSASAFAGSSIGIIGAVIYNGWWTVKNYDAWFDKQIEPKIEHINELTDKIHSESDEGKKNLEKVFKILKENGDDIDKSNRDM